MRTIILLITLFWGSLAIAVEPEEMLDDPVLEARARALSTVLRCPVCQNESIDESNATLAKDLRVILRERIAAGDTDDEAVDYLVFRFGEFILMSPNRQGVNVVLWWSGPFLLLIALVIGWRAIRPKQVPAQPLTQDEQDRLDELLNS